MNECVHVPPSPGQSMCQCRALIIEQQYLIAALIRHIEAVYEWKKHPPIHIIKPGQPLDQ